MKKQKHATSLLELEDFHDLIDSHKYSSLEYLLFFDYDMASDLIKKRRINDLKIEKNVAHEFSVGMSLTGDFGTKEDEGFLACWRREIVDDYEIEKVPPKIFCSAPKGF